MTTDKSKVFDKIRKCLALSKSSNEHEAAAALRQAHALMRLHGINEDQVEAASVGDAATSAGAKRRPPLWEAALVGIVGTTFGCAVIFERDWKNGYWRFVGVGQSAEIAAYAFEVLFRQCRKARAEYIAARLKHCASSRKIERADMFCRAWVGTVAQQVSEFADTKRDAAIATYLRLKYPETADSPELNPRDRTPNRKVDRSLYMDFLAGKDAGQSARLHHGVGASSEPLQLS
ncbi:hypothetical protein BVER_01716 [Candidatus Burkholderia verschuerenii]|uniref:Uncharacterized protein n=1 Tax=Candidatus Burkholderia verschuerenii TaxID=242163 RepID=A0A0L0MIY6_9BURK|nr:DUF2786 domain-containing protein [Candidatus Burkholderia verschuerenii]KND62278.1 hypothetical protein BVER_01716 [Candidatus Burkholderia verschuerenii]